MARQREAVLTAVENAVDSPDRYLILLKENVCHLLCIPSNGILFSQLYIYNYIYIYNVYIYMFIEFKA